ncbi:MAG: SRPBCC family protein [Sphingomonas sp.]
MQVSRIIKAPRATLYAACLDPDMLARWRAPDRMSGVVHSFDARVGGSYRMSLLYKASKRGTGKTSSDTDSFTGRFVELVPDEKIVESIAFESDDPAYAGAMTLTTSFEDVPGGTNVTLKFDGLPPGIRPEDNETGTRQSLAKLAALVE